MEETDHDAVRGQGDGCPRPREPVELDLDALLAIVDVRPDESSLAAEAEWTERHLAAARRALQIDFDPKSRAIFECLLSGQRVADVARQFGASDQAVYKIKQRVTRRLSEVVRRSIEIEEARDARDVQR